MITRLMLVPVLMLAGCSSTAEKDPTEAVSSSGMVISHQLHCGQPAGVRMNDAQTRLVIALGSRPSAGYQVVVSDDSENGQRLQLSYDEQAPAKDAITASVMTSPCAMVDLPAGWQTLKVRHAEELETFVNHSN